MKRLLAITLSIIMVSSLCACGDNKESKIDCSNCGESISKDVAFCEHCGAAVNNEKSESEDTSSDNSSSTESKTEETSKSTEISKPSTPTHTHSYGNETITKKPTCTEQGIKTYYCNSCSSTKIEQVDALGHNWQTATCASPKRCSNCNSTEGEALQHEYSNNECILCYKKQIIFDYSLETYPLENHRFGGIVITDLKCNIENNEIYAEVTYTSKTNNIFIINIGLVCNEKKVSSYEEYVIARPGENRAKILVASEATVVQLEGKYYPCIYDWK